jgi:hypothetical protein
MSNITVDTEVLAFTDQLIREFDLVSILRPFPVDRGRLRIGLAAQIKKFADQRANKVKESKDV